MWRNRLGYRWKLSLGKAQGYGDRNVSNRAQNYPIEANQSETAISGMSTHDDFHGNEKTWSRFPNIPVEDAFMRYSHARMFTTEPILL
jgi:hypothetical protein